MENIGKRFGDRVIIGLAEPRISIRKKTGSEARYKRYLCRCKCGDESPVCFARLVFGGSLQCKRCTQEAQRSVLDVGYTINSWTIVKQLGIKPYGGTAAYVYLCKCPCGNLVEKTKGALCAYDLEMCAKCRAERVKKINPRERAGLIREGDIFGAWIVIGFEITPTGRISKGMIICKCVCGLIKTVKSCDLKHARTTRCRECFLKVARRDEKV